MRQTAGALRPTIRIHGVEFDIKLGMTSFDFSIESLSSAVPLYSYLSVLAYTLPLCAIFFAYFWLSKWLVRKLDAALSKLNAIGASILRRREDASPLVEGNGPSHRASSADWQESILLPNQTEPIQRVGMDIGGSLAKLVYFQPNPTAPPLTESQEVLEGEDGDLKERVSGGRLRFIKFEVRKLDELLEFMKRSRNNYRASFSLKPSFCFNSRF